MAASDRPPAPRPRTYKRRISKATKNEIVRLYESGKSTRAVAATVEVSRTAVMDVLHARRVQLRPAHRHS